MEVERKEAQETLSNYYRAQGIVGGGDARVCVVGGLHDVKEYATSVMSSAKQKLIRDIAKDLSQRLALKDIKPDADIDTLISQLQKHIPDPRKGKSWKPGTDLHKKTCRILAQSINKHFGNENLIDDGGDSSDICDKVAEVMYSLFTGIHGEFLSVQEDVERILKNLNTLSEITERNFSQLESRMAKSAKDDDSSVMGETAMIRDVQKATMDEVKRQQLLLQNMLNVSLAPRDKDLAALLKETKSMKNLVNKIKKVPGDSKFGEKLSYVISGIGSVAQMANFVDKALKEVHMSLDEYSRERDYSDLKEKLNKLLQSHMGDKSASTIARQLKAMETLYRYQYKHDDIVNELRKKKKGSGAKGGADVKIGGLKLDKRVRKIDEVRKGLLKAFNQRFASYLERLLSLTDQVGQEIASGKVELSDDLRKWVKSQEVVPNLEQRFRYYSLTGYYRGIRAKEERESFLSGAKHVMQMLDRLIKNKSYSNLPFRELKANWEGMVTLIRDFSDKFQKGFGVIVPKEIAKSLGQGEAKVEGGGKKSSKKTAHKKTAHKKSSKKREDNVEDEKREEAEEKREEAEEKREEIEEKREEAEEKREDGEEAKEGEVMDEERAEEAVKEGGAVSLPELNKVAYNMRMIKTTLENAYRIASMRQSLKDMAPELDHYATGYDRVLGDAIGKARDDIQTALNAEIKALKDAQKPGAAPGNKYVGLWNDLGQAPWGTQVPPAGMTDTQRKDAFDKLEKMLQQQYTAKDTMLRVAESVDTYMKNFTDGIAKNPDDIQKLTNMLTSTEVISRWFTDKSGNYLCQVFDTFPGYYQVADARFSHLAETWDAKDDMSAKRGVHYYWRVQYTCRSVPYGVASANMAAEAAASNAVEDTLTRAGVANWAAWYTPTTAHADPLAGAPAATDVGVPGIPYLGIPITHELSRLAPNETERKHLTGEKAISYVKKGFEHNSVLKNIISCFINIGDKFGIKELRKETNMSPVQIYKGLLDYMTYGAFNVGIVDTEKGGSGGILLPVVAGTGNNDLEDVVNNNNSIKNGTIKLGITGEGNAYAPVVAGVIQAESLTLDAPALRELHLRQETFVTMRSVPGALGPVQYFNDIFANAALGCNTDWLFQLVIKAIVAKILTVIGVYNLVHRPVDKNTLGYHSSTRLILGGDDEYPDVITDAVELYVRLPLTAEFYRELLDFQANQVGLGDRDAPTLSMVPEMDGTFSGLIELIFDSARHVKFGTYSSTHVRALVSEINKIYLKYRNSKNLVSDVIDDFIKEVNRRYGILKAVERQRYKDLLAKKFDDQFTAPEERVDFEILPGGEDDPFKRPGPSDSFRTVPGPGSDPARDHKYEIDPTHQVMVNQLKGRLERKFREVYDALRSDITGIEAQDELKRFSFEEAIKARTEELKYAKTKRDRFNVVTTAINGFGEFSISSLERPLLLFHETVVAGLSSLMGMYVLLEKFRSDIFQMANTVRYLNDQTVGAYSAAAALTPMAMANIVLAANVANAGGDPLLLRTVAPRDNIPAGSQGNVGAADVTFVEINNVGNTAPTSKPHELRLREMVYRFALRQDHLYLRLFEMLFAHANDLHDVVELRMEPKPHPDVMSEQWLIDSLKANNVDEQEKPHTYAIFVDHSKLKELIDTQVRRMKQMMDKFRGLIPKKIMDSYELYKDSMGNDQVGSLYWLERHLVDRLLYGRDTDSATRQNWEDKHIEMVNNEIKVVIDYLTKPWRFNARDLEAGNAYSAAGGATDAATTAHFWAAGAANALNLQVAGLAGAAPLAVSHSQENRLGELSKFLTGYIYHAAPWNHLSAASVLTNTAAPGLLQLLRKQPDISGFTTVGAGGAAYGNLIDQGLQNMYQFYDSINGNINFNDKARGLLFMFNKILAMYLKQFYDEGTQKIYLNVINKFANGAFSDAIMRGTWLDDSAEQVGLPAGRRGPNFQNAERVLFRSLAVMLRSILTVTMPRKTEKHYLETDLAEVPLYMKENYKANMPVFKKLLTLLQKKCSLVNVLVRRSYIRQEVDIDTAPAVIGGVPLPAVVIPGVTSLRNRDRYLFTLDRLVDGCKSLVSCIDDVLSEMNDDPLYLETRRESIKDYETSNGRIPLMPVSTTLYYLQNLPRFGIYELDSAMPVHNLGSDSFKLLYGTRGLLNNGELNMSKTPGMIAIVKGHNESTEAEYHITEGEVGELQSAMVQMVRYMVDLKHYKSALSLFIVNDTADSNVRGYDNGRGAGVLPGYYNHTNEDLIADASPNVPAGARIIPSRAVYAFNTNTNRVRLSDLISVTEDSDQNISRTKYVQKIQRSDQTIVRGSRDQIRTMNFIDMNKVPISFHALMREVPLINLYNYAQTFDSMVGSVMRVDQDMYGLSRNYTRPAAINDILNGAMEPSNENARKVLAWLLLHPYATMDAAQFDTFGNMIVRGALGIDGLGRPKFLGDEVWNKSLFQEMVTGNDPAPGAPYLEEFDEAGTASYSRNPPNLRPVNDGTLRYLAANKRNTLDIVHVAVGVPGAPRYKELYQLIGKMRFDTIYMRNIFWLTNLQRVLRYKMRNDLTWYDRKVVSSNAVLAKSITELYGTDMHNPETDNYVY